MFVCFAWTLIGKKSFSFLTEKLQTHKVLAITKEMMLYAEILKRTSQGAAKNTVGNKYESLWRDTPYTRRHRIL